MSLTPKERQWVFTINSIRAEVPVEAIASLVDY